VAEIGTIAVIGAGAPGRRIAQLSALAGFRTILEDIVPASLRRAESEIRDALGRAVKSGIITGSAAQTALTHIEYATSIEEAARTADLIIEAVPDELESKIEILTLLDKVAEPATILASTTSSFSITELAHVTYRAKKVLGMRFLGSSEETKLQEIVRAQETDDETVEACAKAGLAMGKKVVVIAEAERSSTEYLSG
jgi:3-hydroxybutyryl-CoA dehydrogenase